MIDKIKYKVAKETDSLLCLLTKKCIEWLYDTFIKDDPRRDIDSIVLATTYTIFFTTILIVLMISK